MTRFIIENVICDNPILALITILPAPIGGLGRVLGAERVMGL